MYTCLANLVRVHQDSLCFQTAPQVWPADVEICRVWTANSIARVPESRRTDYSDDICSPYAHLTTPLLTCRPAGKKSKTKFMEGTLAVTQKHKGHILVEHQLYSFTSAACNHQIDRFVITHIIFRRLFYFLDLWYLDADDHRLATLPLVGHHSFD